MSNVTYSPSHRQAGAPVTNIQSKIRTAPYLCKNNALAVLLGSNGNSYTTSTQSEMYMYVYIYIHIHTHTHTHILHNIETLAGENKYKHRDSSECGAPRISLRMPLLVFLPKVRQPCSRSAAPLVYFVTGYFIYRKDISFGALNLNFSWNVGVLLNP